MAVRRKRKRGRTKRKRRGHVNVGGSLFPLLAWVHKKKKQKGSGWWQDFKRNTRQGYKETHDLIKQNKALQRLLSHQWYH